MEKKKQFPAFVTLGIISVVAAVILAAVNMVTAPVIAANKAAAQAAAFASVMPAESYEELTIPAGYSATTLVAAKNGSDVVGYCVTASKGGYGGPVAVTLGVDANGIVTGCVIGDSDFVETSGLGSSWKEPAYCERLVGIDAINGGGFDAKSGATITSTAVRDAANEGLRTVVEVGMGKTAIDPIVTFGAGAAAVVLPDGPVAIADGDYTVKAQGFQSEVSVDVTFADGAIAALTVHSADETNGFGTRANENADFASQFIGKQVPLTIGTDVDALAGATVTSTAVVNALNSLCAVDEAPAEPVEVADGSYTVKAQGFQSEVSVDVTVADGAITALTVHSADETNGFGTRVNENADFAAQFVGKKVPVALGEGIDAVAGATVTSTAVVTAVNKLGTADAVAVAATEAAPAAEEAAPEATEAPAAEQAAPEATEAPAAEEAAAPVEVADGSYTVKAQGFQSEVAVDVTVADGAISALTVHSADETNGFGTRVNENADFAAQFVGKKVPVALGEGIDAVAGATVTSTAVVTAVNKLGTDEAVAVAATEAAPAAEEAAPEATEAPAAEEAAAPVEVADGSYTVKAQGFQSEVSVDVTVADGAIAALTVHSADETNGFGTRVNENADFAAQFVGKKVPVALGEGIDAVAGATVTSTAVVTAVNKLGTDEAAPAAEVAAETALEAPADASEAVDPMQFAGKTATGTAQGFQSEVVVQVTMDANGAIQAIVVNANGETNGIGTRTMTQKEFQAQFPGKTLPLVLGGNIDALAGATVTSTAIVNAINNAFIGQ